MILDLARIIAVTVKSRNSEQLTLEEDQPQHIHPNPNSPHDWNFDVSVVVETLERRKEGQNQPEVFPFGSF